MMTTFILILLSALCGVVIAFGLVIGVAQSHIQASRQKEELDQTRREEILSRTAERQRLAEMKHAKLSNEAVLVEIKLEKARLELEQLQKEAEARKSFTPPSDYPQ